MIFVFKTSVKKRQDVLRLSLTLNKLLKSSKWVFDLEDCDNILRIDSEREISDTIVNLLLAEGYACEELPD